MNILVFINNIKPLGKEGFAYVDFSYISKDDVSYSKYFLEIMVPLNNITSTIINDSIKTAIENEIGQAVILEFY